MTAIKSYTDIEQSKKLAEILPLESADMFYNLGESKIPNFIYGSHSDFRCYTMCWSLAALLNILPNENMLVKTTDGEYYYLAKDVMTKHYNNPVDACVVMIEKLHELKML